MNRILNLVNAISAENDTNESFFEEKRRLILTNLSILLVLFLTGIFFTFFYFNGRPLAFIMGISLGIYVLAMWLNSTRRCNLAKILLIITGSLQIGSVSFLVGETGNIHLFLIPAALSLFLYFSKSENLWLILSLSWCFLLYFLLHITFFIYEPKIILDSTQLQFLRRLTSISCFIACTLFTTYLCISNIRMEEKLSNAKQRIETILLNILPSPVVSKLMYSKSMVVNEFSEATILFADIVSFTDASKTISPSDQAKILNNLYSDFDSILEEIGLEKIRSIGDQYVAAAGLPIFREDHAEATIEVAMRMLDVATHHTFNDKNPITLRIGINTGPVVAGIISKKRISYDIWGNTVNMASRMESKGLPHRIQVSEDTYHKLKDIYRFSPRRVVEANGYGQIGAYIFKGRF